MPQAWDRLLNDDCDGINLEISRKLAPGWEASSAIPTPKGTPVDSLFASEYFCKNVCYQVGTCSTLEYVYNN